jgi:arabinose-5-phosphate isomerase
LDRGIPYAYDRRNANVVEMSQNLPQEQPNQDRHLLDAMRGVVSEEAAALTKLVSLIDGSWLGAVAALDAARRGGGRVIVSGVGKSGHVARKIAATLASTGTPAFFMHGTEASHGDLGMALPGDAVLLLSASGGTRELLDLAHFAVANSIPLIVISRVPDSPLGRLSSHVIRLPDVPEACPNGQAPTTSSTAMMAAGDALAIALMRLAGFGPDDFRRVHPGGTLGQRPAG